MSRRLLRRRRVYEWVSLDDLLGGSDGSTPDPAAATPAIVLPPSARAALDQLRAVAAEADGVLAAAALTITERRAAWAGVVGDLARAARPTDRRCAQHVAQATDQSGSLDALVEM